MKITDIIRSVLDLVDQGEQMQQQQAQDAEAEQLAVIMDIPVEPEQCIEPGVDELAIIQQLAGMPCDEPSYANEPAEVIAPLKAAYPAGDDMHASKNPADIRADSFSMYPNYQAPKR